eukprot:1161569-Pelagomonas_calceolata.AAC.3
MGFANTHTHICAMLAIHVLRDVMGMIPKQPRILWSADLPERFERVVSRLVQLHPSGNLCVLGSRCASYSYIPVGPAWQAMQGFLSVVLVCCVARLLQLYNPAGYSAQQSMCLLPSACHERMSLMCQTFHVRVQCEGAAGQRSPHCVTSHILIYDTCDVMWPASSSYAPQT